MMIFIAAFLVGAALSVVGASFQSVLRNPLAEPYLMGTVGGGALFAASAVVFGWTAIGSWVMPTMSFLGSTFALAVVCLVAFVTSKTRQTASPLVRGNSSSFVLAGFVTGGFFGSLDMLVLSFATESDYALVSKWLYGSLNAVTPTTLIIGAIVFVSVFAVQLSISKYLDVLELGRNEAECLGVNARAILIFVFASSALMTAVSVALAGAVGFVGLVVPHIIRRLAGPRMRRVLIFSALFGGLYLVDAQIVVSCLSREIPVGVIAAIIGSPFLFAILLSPRNGEGWDV